MTTKDDESKSLLELQKRMEASLKDKTQKRSEEKAAELEISRSLLKYLEELENRIDGLERKVDKLYAARE